MQKSPLKVHANSWARDLIFGLSHLYLHTHCISVEKALDSGGTAQRHRLVRPFATRNCDKYQNLVCWSISYVQFDSRMGASEVRFIWSTLLTCQPCRVEVGNIVCNKQWTLGTSGESSSYGSTLFLYKRNQTTDLVKVDMTY